MAGRDAISNILLRIRGEDEDATDTVDSLSARLQEFGKESATAEADVKFTGNTELDEAIASLRAFGQTKATAEADVKVSGEEKVAALLAAVESVKATHIEEELDLRGGDTALAELKAIDEAAKSLASHTDIPIKLSGEEKVAAMAAAIEAVRTATERPIEVPVEIEGAAKDLAIVTAIEEAARLLGRPIKVPVETSGIAKAEAELFAAEQAAKRLGNTRINLGSMLGNLASNAVSGLFDRINSGLESIQGAGEQAGKALGGVTVNLGLFGLKLGPTVAVVLALAAAIGVSLVGALSLLVTAAAGAVAGIAALATAFAGALGPAVVLIVATISQLVKILKVVKDLDAARDAQTRKTADGTKAQAQAEEQRRQRLLAVKDATMAVVSAEREYKQARESAAEAIKAANEAQSKAQDDLRQANEAIKTETVNAYEAMKRAALDAVDAMLNVKDAKLSVEDAKLAVKDAAQNVLDFRKATDTAGASLNGLFKKFEDVNFTGNIKQGLIDAGLDPKQAEEGEKLIQALRHAKINEARATNNVKKAELDEADARRTNNKYKRDGIAAYQPLTDAIRRQKDAQEALAKATEQANKLDKEGIDKNPQVLQARDALTRAEERLSEARRKQAHPVDGLADDAAKARQEFDKLSPAAQKFALFVQQAKKEAGGFASAISEGVLGGITAAGGHVASIMKSLAIPFALFGKTVGDAIANFFKAFDNPVAKVQFALLIAGAATLAKIIGGPVFINFTKLFLAVAIAAMPYLIRLMGKLGNALGDLNQKASTGDGLPRALGVIFGLLRGVFGLVKAVGRVFLAFFVGTSSDAKGFLSVLTNVLNNFADFLNSPKGRKELHQFFADVIPLAVSVGKLVFALIGFLIKLTQVIAPAATVFFNGFSLVFGILSKVLGFLRPVLQYAILFGSAFFGSGLLGRLKEGGGLLGGLVAIVRSFFVLAGRLGIRIVGLVSKIGFVKAAFDLLGKVGGSAFHHIGGVAASAFGRIKSLASSAVSHIGSVFGGVGHLIAQGFRKGINFAKGLVSTFYNIGKDLVTGFANGIASIAKTLANAGKKAGGAVVKGAKKVLHIGSPSKVFHEIGVDTARGLSNGLLASRGQLARDVRHSIAPVVTHTREAVRIQAPKFGVGDLRDVGASHTSVGDIILQTAGGGTPDGYTAAQQIKRQMTKLGR